MTTSASGIYTASNSPSNLVIFLTNGYGTFKPPATLTPGGKYKLTAVPKPKNIFAGWIGGTNQPYSLLSYSTTYTFTNELNLVLEANFETNVFLAAEGAYRGLFGPANESDRQQTNSGSFSMNVTSTGSCSGTLDLGGQNISFSGKLNPDGLAGITTKAIRSVPALDMTLQLDFADQSVSGTISNSDGSLTAVLNGYRAVFGGTEKATAFLGRYTLVVPGVSDSTVGPFGDGYGTVTVSSAGAVARSGSVKNRLRDDIASPSGSRSVGTTVNNFAADSLSSAPSLSWINSTNASKLASYRAGFTNQQVTLRGSLYSPNLPFPSGLAETLGVGGLADITNKLTLKTNKATGIISGSFANPSNPK